MSMGDLASDLEDLYRRRQGALQVMLASVTGSIEGARDVVQEAFAQALRDQDGFRGEGSLEAWVWRIAFRAAIGSKGSRELALDELPDVVDLREVLVQPLTAAELRVLAYLPTHLSLQEIADRLVVSRNTVKTHSVAVYRKLGVSSRSDAVDAARRFGYLQGTEDVPIIPSG